MYTILIQFIIEVLFFLFLPEESMNNFNHYLFLV